jgi:hypothetical protein
MTISAIRPILSCFLSLWIFAASEPQAAGSRIPDSVPRTADSGSRPSANSEPAGPEPRIPNTESRKGWIPLSDGNAATAWRGACKKAFPDSGWVYKNGMLTVLARPAGSGGRGGDIVSIERFADFDLRFEFRVSEGANSGVKYFVHEDLAGAKGAAIGWEYQILDDDRNEDAGAGINGNHANASLYDLVPARNKPNRPAGEWNSGRILVKAGRIEHWLNGVKVVECERGTAEFRGLVAVSKYRIFPGFGEWKDGRILLQDHGGEVSFRNIRIRRL